MTSITNNNENTINSLVDDELDSDERAELLAQLEGDPQLQNDLCDTYRIKGMLKMAYPDPTPQIPVSNSQPQKWWSSIAASILLLAIGFGLGDNFASNSVPQPFNLSQVPAEHNKLVLFISSSDNTKFKTTLAMAEEFLKANKHENIQVNVVTSAGGIDLLDKEKSQFISRINYLSKTYDALDFIACNNTILRFKDQGRDVSIIDAALVSPSAVQFVVNRLQQGWSYVAI